MSLEYVCGIPTPEDVKKIIEPFCKIIGIKLMGTLSEITKDDFPDASAPGQGNESFSIFYAKQKVQKEGGELDARFKIITQCVNGLCVIHSISFDFPMGEHRCHVTPDGTFCFCDLSVK